MVVRPKIGNKMILQEEKVQVSRLLEVFGSQTGIPKGLKKKENCGGEEELMIFEFGGHGRDDDFEISEGKRGLKYSCHLW